MGIEYYTKWLIDNHGSCFVPRSGNNMYDYIYIDLNHTLHTAIHGVATEHQFFGKVKESLLNLLIEYFPRRKLIIAIDGPSPWAKVILQRERRLSSSRKTNLTRINALHITPGTQLLKNLEKFLIKTLNIIAKQYVYIKLDYVILSSDLPNEGEVKLFKELIKYGTQDPDATHLVVGNDADLVVLALACQSVNHINLLSRAGILSLDKFLRSIMNNNNLYGINQDATRQDLVIISIMGGNDYLPKLGYVTIDKLFATYKKYRATGADCITQNNTFIVPNFKQFLDMLNKLVMGSYKKFKIENYDQPKIKNYLDGLLWCLDMYNHGTCSMYDYVYTNSGVILPIYVKYYLDFYGSPQTPKSNTPPLTSEVYTLITMPKAAKNLIPKKYHKLLDTDLKDLYELEECDACGEIRGQLSSLYKELSFQRKAEQDTSTIRKKIGDVIKLYNCHKKTHRPAFQVTDVKRILELTQNI